MSVTIASRLARSARVLIDRVQSLPLLSKLPRVTDLSLQVGIGRLSVALLFVAVALSCAFPTAHGEDFTWRGMDNNYENDENWLIFRPATGFEPAGRPPGMEDSIRFTIGAFVELKMDEVGSFAQQLLVEDGDVILGPAGGKLTITSEQDAVRIGGPNMIVPPSLTVQQSMLLSAGELLVGEQSEGGDDEGAGGLLTITGRSPANELNLPAQVMNTSAIIGGREHEIGVVIVSGSMADWFSDGDVIIGDLGNGDLLIEEGGTAMTALFGGHTLTLGADASDGFKGEGKARLIGGSKLESDHIVVGDLGKGTLSIEEGSSVVGNLSVVIGVESKDQNKITVEGEGSILRTTKLNIAERGKGTLELKDQAKVNLSLFNESGIPFREVNIAMAEGSLGTLNVSSGAELSAEELVVGVDGEALVNLDGGRVLVPQGLVTIAEGELSRATLNVGGEGSRLAAVNLDIGEGGHAELFVNSFGTVDVFLDEVGLGGISIGKKPNSRGVLRVKGNQAKVESAELGVGTAGDGVVEIGDEGQVSVRHTATLGESAEGTGRIVLDTSNMAATGANLSAGTMIVGDAGNATMEIKTADDATRNSSVIVNETLTLADDVGATGTVSLSGRRSALIAGNLIVGKNGIGTVNAQGEATMDVGGVRIGGTTTIGQEASASGSSFTAKGVDPDTESFLLETEDLNIGVKGSGSMTVETWSNITVRRTTTVGGFESEGGLTIKDSAQATTKELKVGGGGMSSKGELTIDRGKLSVSENMAIGSGEAMGSSTVTVKDTLASLDVKGALNLFGAPGGNVLNIQEGASVNAKSMRITSSTIPNRSDVNIEGRIVGDNTTRSFLRIEDSLILESGVITLEKGGTLQTGAANLGSDASGRATVTVADRSNWRINSATAVSTFGHGNADSKDQVSAEVVVQVGGILQNTGPAVRVVEGGSVVGSGTIIGVPGARSVPVPRGVPTVGDNPLLHNLGGVVAPGDSTGVLTIDGDYIQEGNGVLEIEIGGTVAGTEYDVLSVIGEASLGGTLLLTPVLGFQPQLGQTFDIVSAISISGDFDTVDTSAFGPGVQFQFSQSGGTLSATTVAIPEPATVILLLLGVVALWRMQR